jgi:hypothetical protein
MSSGQTVVERWYGQGDERGGLHMRTRIDPTCDMVDHGRCGKPATARANLIDLDPRPRYPSDMFWCPEHAEHLLTDRGGW